MNLKDFVANTLAEIVEGCKEADSRVAGHGGSVNPLPRGRVIDTLSWRGVPLQSVEFDVAVTAAEESEVSGGVKVVGMRVGGASTESSTSISRVRFAVPLAMPQGTQGEGE